MLLADHYISNHYHVLKYEVISLQLLSFVVNCVTCILEILGFQFSMVSNFIQVNVIFLIPYHGQL